MRLIIAILFSAFTFTAQASTAYSDHYESLDELTDASTLIVRGVVHRRLDAYQVQRVYKERPHIRKQPPLMTPFVIKVDEVIKGLWDRDQLRVMQAGGETAEYSQVIFEAPLLEVGQAVVLFLEPHVNGEGEETGRFVIVGLNDGVFLVEGEEMLKLEGSGNSIYAIDTIPIAEISPCDCR